MQIVETSVFTKRVKAHLSDEEYRRLHLAVCFRPEQGALVPGGGGLRKLRWHLETKGKRGGLRILYYWDPAAATIYMLFVYSKSQREDLTQQQVKTLSRLIKEELN
jgi:hypothetical protein